jgi:6-pyruvoyltetrahydropterin/6-carboxytetrahydropterin synthase
MISLTKIFRFETAHAIYGYEGPCAHIHGHSYELHVRVAAKNPEEGYLGGIGIIIDFKDLKKLVREAVVNKLDHKLVLSKTYLAANPQALPNEPVVVFEAEPTAENLLVFIRIEIMKLLPRHIRLESLRLWETRDSYAEWCRE